MSSIPFECPALQGMTDRYNGLFGIQLATIVRLMWQHDTRAFAQFIKKCMDAHGDPGLERQASDQQELVAKTVQSFSPVSISKSFIILNSDTVCH